MSDKLSGRLTPERRLDGTLNNKGTLSGVLGGAGAVVKYASLPDKPSINGVTLVGNKTTSDLNINYNDLKNLPSIPDVGEIDERLDNLGGRVTTAEGNITSLDGRVTTNEGDISDLQDDTSALDTRLTTAEGNITSLGGRVTTAEGNITSLGGRVTTAEGNITSLDGRVTTNEGDISDLQGNMSQAQSDIVKLNSSLTPFADNGWTCRKNADNSYECYISVDVTASSSSSYGGGLYFHQSNAIAMPSVISSQVIAKIASIQGAQLKILCGDTISISNHSMTVYYLDATNTSGSSNRCTVGIHLIGK